MKLLSIHRKGEQADPKYTEHTVENSPQLIQINGFRIEKKNGEEKEATRQL